MIYLSKDFGEPASNLLRHGIITLNIESRISCLLHGTAFIPLPIEQLFLHLLNPDGRNLYPCRIFK